MRNDASRILHSLRQGYFRLTRHAKARMEERRVSFEDIRNCADTVKSQMEQGNGIFLFVGDDLDGDELKIVAAWDGEAIVITLIGD